MEELKEKLITEIINYLLKRFENNFLSTNDIELIKVICNYLKSDNQQ